MCCTVDVCSAVSYITKLLNWKQITTTPVTELLSISCFLYNKVTKLKTNHNCIVSHLTDFSAVSYITKLLNWKQITTPFIVLISLVSCFLYNKVTKLKTNHNNIWSNILHHLAVSYITKLLNWKQITTLIPEAQYGDSLFPI